MDFSKVSGEVGISINPAQLSFTAKNKEYGKESPGIDEIQK